MTVALSTKHAVKTLVHWTFNCASDLHFLAISSHNRTAKAMQCQCKADQSFPFCNERSRNHMKVQETRLQSARLLTFVDVVQYVQSHCCSVSLVYSWPLRLIQNHYCNYWAAAIIRRMQHLLYKSKPC